MMTKTELLKALRQSGSEVTDHLRTVSPAEFEQGRYEEGWNARQILAHIASIEWTYPKLIDVAMQPVEITNQPPKAEAKGGIGSYNERQVAKRADATVEELLAEFETNRRATIKAVEETDDQTLSKEVVSAGGFRGPLAQVLHWVAVDHVKTHLHDIVGEDRG